MSSNDSGITGRRRTVLKALGVVGTSLFGVTGSAAAKPGKGPKNKEKRNGRGRGRWCRSDDEHPGRGRGKGKGKDRGRGYRRDHPHSDHPTRWDDHPGNPGRGDDEDDEDDEDRDDDDQEDGEGPSEDPEPTPEDPEDGDEDADDGSEDDSEDEDEDEDESDEPESVAAQIESRIHSEVNEYREENDLDPLEQSDDLAEVAREHSADMAERNYFSHTSPEGDDPGDRLEEAGIDCSGWAENLAYEYDSEFSADDAASVADSIVQGWIDSDGHRQNLLGDFEEEGIGVDVRDGTVMATQLFCSDQ